MKLTRIRTSRGQATPSLAASQGGDPPATVDREAMVREAAYFIHLNSGQGAGHELDDWLAAEAQVAGRSGLRCAQAAGPRSPP